MNAIGHLQSEIECCVSTRIVFNADVLNVGSSRSDLAGDFSKYAATILGHDADIDLEEALYDLRPIDVHPVVPLMA